MIKVIAEIGWNHCGDMNLAKKFIKAASKSGADFAKFQTWSTSRLKSGDWDNDGRREIYNNAELSEEDHLNLIDCCNQNNILFLSSVFSISDAELLIKIGCKEVKIPSFESRNIDLIKFCDKNFETIILSTGTSSLEEIKKSVSYIASAKLFLMHCVSVYPQKYSESNLPRMKRLMDITQNVGLSDHIQGVESSKIAIGEGAVIIEKHFTIDRELPGRDNKFSILPNQLKDLTEYIKNRDLMFKDWGDNYLEKEQDTRINYTGRFNG
jgi:N,N'-diacetyllegionaminate synthase